MRLREPLLVEVALLAAALLYTAACVAGAPGSTRNALPTAPASSPSAQTPPSAQTNDGLSDSYEGFRLVPVTLPTHRGSAQPVAFQIHGPDGAPVQEYAIAHTKPLHLYLVRDDLSRYRHLHPELVGDTWRALVDVPDGGAYRLYAEFAPRDQTPIALSRVLGVPFAITGDTSAAPLPTPVAEATVDGYSVRRSDGTAPLQADRDALLTFYVTTGGAPARLEPFLGASAHVSAFERTGALAHIHAAREPGPDGSVTVHVRFPRRGEQRLFLEFQVDGRIHQAAFTLVVS